MKEEGGGLHNLLQPAALAASLSGHAVATVGIADATQQWPWWRPDDRGGKLAALLG